MRNMKQIEEDRPKKFKRREYGGELYNVVGVISMISDSSGEVGSLGGGCCTGINGTGAQQLSAAQDNC